MNNNKIAIGAIFKNEIHYIVEWVAWHNLAGFKFFYIADNESTDGTRSLLEAISEIDSNFHIFYQPSVEMKNQERAYSTILNLCDPKIQSILFIDADEFLVHDSYENGAEYEHLENILESQDIGMVAINWRCYGSSGLTSFSNEPVLERFTYHCDDNNFSKNHYIKSVSKISYVLKNTPHYGLIHPSLKMVDCTGNHLNEFISSEKTWVQCETATGLSKKITPSPLRINHYVIKSKDEFINLKSKRGSSWGSPSDIKDLSYFIGHDFYDKQSFIPEEKLKALRLSIKNLYDSISKSSYAKKFRGNVDINNADIISGWAIEENGTSNSIIVNIFVNGMHVGKSLCKYYRKDVMDAGISTGGFCGFRFQHPNQLKEGDKVEVFLNANNAILGGYPSIKIGANQ